MQDIPILNHSFLSDMKRGQNFSGKLQRCRAVCRNDVPVENRLPRLIVLRSLVLRPLPFLQCRQTIARMFDRIEHTDGCQKCRRIANAAKHFAAVHTMLDQWDHLLGMFFAPTHPTDEQQSIVILRCRIHGIIRPRMNTADGGYRLFREGNCLDHDFSLPKHMNPRRYIRRFPIRILFKKCQ